MFAYGILWMKHITIQTDLKDYSNQTGKIKNRSMIIWQNEYIIYIAAMNGKSIPAWNFYSLAHLNRN